VSGPRRAFGLLPPPLWGLVGEGWGGGKLHMTILLFTPSLSLPHKGGGNVVALIFVGTMTLLRACRHNVRVTLLR